MHTYDFTVIQQAIDEVASRGGGVVPIKPGVYYGKTPLVVPANITIEGCTIVCKKDCTIIYKEEEAL